MLSSNMPQGKDNITPVAFAPSSQFKPTDNGEKEANKQQNILNSQIPEENAKQEFVISDEDLVAFEAWKRENNKDLNKSNEPQYAPKGYIPGQESNQTPQAKIDIQGKETFCQKICPSCFSSNNTHTTTLQNAKQSAKGDVLSKI